MLSLETKYAVQVLTELSEAARKEQRLTLVQLKPRGAFNAKILADVLHRLKNARIVGLDALHYYLRRDLSEVTLYELCEAVDEDFILRHSRLPEGWTDTASKKHLRTMTLDTKLTVEVGDLLRRIPVSKLMPAGMRTAGVRKKDSPEKHGKLLTHQPIQKWLEVDLMARG